MKYQHKKNGKVVTLLEVREKFKTVMVQPESMDDNNGLPYDITTSTFKRWWKKIEDAVEVEQPEDVKTETEDEYVKEVMKQKEDLGIEVPEINPADVEIVEEPVKKRGRKANQVNDTVKNLLEEINHIVAFLGGFVNVPRDENMRFRALCNCDGRQICKLMWSNKKIRLYFRTEVVCEAYKDFVKVNYSLPYLYEIDNYTKETVEKIKNLLILAINNDHRKTKKEEK